jgi:hypothetical protein
MTRGFSSPQLSCPPPSVSSSTPLGHDVQWTGVTAKGNLGFWKGDNSMLEDGGFDTKRNKPPNVRTQAHPID